MSTTSPGTTSEPFLARPARVTGNEARAVFGQVMGLVACTLGLLALGAFVGRDSSGGLGIAFFVAGFGCLIGLNVAAGRDRQQLSTTLLFALGLCLGLGLGPAINAYAQANPSAVWQAAGATGGFVLALGAVGYGIRRDLASWSRALSWVAVALLAFGIVILFVSIPNANVIWALAGLVIFGGFTILDFNRLRRTEVEEAVPLAAGIFLDILNVFLFLLELFGNARD